MHSGGDAKKRLCTKSWDLMQRRQRKGKNCRRAVLRVPVSPVERWQEFVLHWNVIVEEKSVTAAGKWLFCQMLIIHAADGCSWQSFLQEKH